MAVLSSDLIRQGASTSTGYTIDQSIRFNSADTAHMERTPSSSGNRKIFTSSLWVKLGKVLVNGAVGPGVSYSGVGSAGLVFTNTGAITLYTYYTGSSWTGFLKTNRKFNDPSAWYHIVYILDSTSAIPTERIRLYVNGERETSFANENYLAKDTDTNFNTSGSKMQIGRDPLDSAGYDFDGYLAEMHYLDGYAYGPEYFGEFDENGIWIPKQYTGSYGTNGFFIDGRDASDLGDDESGNGNDFTTSGLASNDQKTDTPTNNMITFNPLNNQRSGGTPSNGNLDYVGPGTRTLISLTANIPSTGKWAVAFKVAQVSTNAGWQIGIAPANQSDFGDAVGSNEDLKLVRHGPSSSDWEISDFVNSASIDPSQPITTSDEFWVAVDMDSGNVYLGLYDASATSMKWVANDTGLDGNPATGDNPTVTYNTTQMPRDNVVFAVGSKQTSQHIYLQRSTDVSGTTPTGYTYFENVKDLV